MSLPCGSVIVTLTSGRTDTSHVTADHAHTLHFAGYPVRGAAELDRMAVGLKFDGSPLRLASRRLK